MIGSINEYIEARKKVFSTRGQKVLPELQIDDGRYFANVDGSKVEITEDNLQSFLEERVEVARQKLGEMQELFDTKVCVALAPYEYANDDVDSFVNEDDVERDEDDVESEDEDEDDEDEPKFDLYGDLKEKLSPKKAKIREAAKRAKRRAQTFDKAKKFYEDLCELIAIVNLIDSPSFQNRSLGALKSDSLDNLRSSLETATPKDPIAKAIFCLQYVLSIDFKNQTFIPRYANLSKSKLAE